MCVERLEFYFIANGMTEDVKKREVSYSDIVDKLKCHFSPKPSIILQRFKFHSRKQLPGETVASFVAELRQLARHSDFVEGSLEEMIRDRLVCGIASSAMQRRLLAEKQLDLQKAHDLALAMEAADKGVKDLQEKGQGASQSSDVNTVYKHKQPRKAKAGGTAKPDVVCYRCGGKHEPHTCRFKYSVCHACKKRGHLAKMCRSKAAQERQERKKSGKPQHANKLESQDTDSGTDIASDSEDELYGMFAIRAKQTDPIEVKLKVNDVWMTMELDTGAAVTVVSERTYQTTWSDRAPVLEPSNVQLRTYTGEQLQVLGNLSVVVQYKDQVKRLPLIVVSGQGPSLMGRNWLEELTLDWQEIQQLQQPKVLQSILDKHTEVFNDELGEIRGVKASIVVDPNAQPRFCRARPVAFALRPKVEREIERLEKQGIVEAVTTSDWAAPVVPVVKRDGTVRLCGDYRLTVNQASKLDSYPLPKVDELFTKLAGGKSFSKLDLQQAYLQLPLDETSKPYTTINTHKGLFQFNRLPFGVLSSPGIFQRAMDTLLQGIPHTAVYMDDILVTGANDQRHLETLDLVLQKLKDAGMKLQKSKCILMAPEVDYLGHKVDRDGVHPTPDKITAIKEAPVPRYINQLKSVLGLLSYYSKFLPNMATALAPLYSLLQSHKRWKWRPKQQKAFEEAKKLTQC